MKFSLQTVTIAVYFSTSLLACAADGPLVELTHQGDEVEVTIGGAPLAVYHTARDRLRPYFANVQAADGTILSRPISPPGGDHPHHTGIWAAVDKVNGIAFWHLESPIVTVSLELPVPQGDPAVMEVTNHWLGQDGQPVVVEQTRVAIFASRLFAYDMTLTASGKDVTFGDTEEGFFAFRMAEWMREEETGKVINADGRTTAKGCWGRTSNWVDYYGELNGKTYGVAIFDHPKNFRPARYHVRDYGLFSVSPFGESDYTKGQLSAQPVSLAAGDSLRLRYAMYFHNGDETAADVAGVYRAYAGASRAE